MNLSWLALALVAMQLLSSQTKAKPSKPNLKDFLSDDTKNLVDCLSNLTSDSAEDKLGAIMQAISNPAVISVAQSIFSKPEAHTKEDETFVNDEGYTFKSPSHEAQEFFKPIEHIADPEVKNKLYTLYDNWYLK